MTQPVWKPAGLDRSPLHREKDDLKLNFVCWTLEFSCRFSFVLWLWLLFWKSGTTWTAWQACRCLQVLTVLCHRARQIMLIPPVFFPASRFVFCLIRWSVKFGIVHWTWNSQAVLSATWLSLVLFLFICLHFSWSDDFLLFFQYSWFVLAEMLERVRSHQFGDFCLKGSKFGPLRSQNKFTGLTECSFTVVPVQ